MLEQVIELCSQLLIICAITVARHHSEGGTGTEGRLQVRQ
jgi:hypothetical protein